MTQLRSFTTLLLGLVIVSGAAAAATLATPGVPAQATAAQALVAAVQATDGSPASLQALTHLVAASETDLTPQQAALLAAAGPVAPNHADLVDQIRAIKADASLGPAQQGFRIAEAATRAQAKALHVELVPVALAGHARPSDALLALAQDARVTLTQDEIAQARALDAVAPGEATALAKVIDAFVAMNDAAARAIAQDAMAPSWGETLSARLALLDATQAFQATLPATPAPDAPHVVAPTLYNVDLSSANDLYTTNYAFSLDAGGDDTYQNNAGGNWLGNCQTPTTASAFLDLGGSDVYAPPYDHGTPGHPIIYPDACGKVGGSDGGVGFLLDAGGSNQFGAGQGDGVNGGAEGPTALGALIALDGEGNAFNAGDRGANGGAYDAGVGLLVDASLGGVSVNGGSEGANGGADQAGLGILVSTDGGSYDAGSDGANGGAEGLGSVGFAYGAGSWYGGYSGVNGGGENGGAGTLVGAGNAQAGGQGVNGGADGAGSTGSLWGNDAYAYGDFGTNGGGSNGGHGTLVATDCFCTAGSYGANGGGYNLGSGFLYAALDGGFNAGGHGANGGADTDAVGILLVGGTGGTGYGAGDVGTNGGAFQGGAGVLIDAGVASASYDAGQEGTNGGTESTGVGLLLDAAGSDRYTAVGFGANGGADTQGHGSLIDLAGDDAYGCTGFACNGAAMVPGSTGLLLDVQGHDTYNGQADQTTPLKGSGLAGNQIDVSPI